MLRPHHFPTLAACVLGLVLLATPAGAINIVIQDDSTRIGNLLAAVDPYGNETAYFTLLEPYRNLLSDSLGLQFRFFQVIYYDDEPVTWMGNILTPAAAPAHSGTVVDTPAGGWDYELPGGDDKVPFYESDTENNPVTNQPYAFPSLSYPDSHTADGISPGLSLTQDGVGLGRPNHQTLIETYLAFEYPQLRAAKTFDILGGYSWGVATTSLAIEYGINPVAIPFSAIDPAKVSELQDALNRSGYAGDNAWTVQAVADFYPLDGVESPEPGSILIVLSGFGALILLRRRWMA